MTEAVVSVRPTVGTGAVFLVSLSRVGGSPDGIVVKGRDAIGRQATRRRSTTSNVHSHSGHSDDDPRFFNPHTDGCTVVVRGGRGDCSGHDWSGETAAGRSHDKRCPATTQQG